MNDEHKQLYDPYEGTHHLHEDPIIEVKNVDLQ